MEPKLPQAPVGLTARTLGIGTSVLPTAGDQDHTDCHQKRPQDQGDDLARTVATNEEIEPAREPKTCDEDDRSHGEKSNTHALGLPYTSRVRRSQSITYVRGECP
jgi:hypothetical protein